MGIITIDVNPIIWQWGTFQLSWHAIASLMAIVTAIAIAVKGAKKQGIAAAEFFSLAPWMIVGGIIGARLFHVFDHWSYYSGNPL